MEYTPSFWGRFGWELLKLGAQEALQIAVARSRTRVARALTRGRLPLTPLERAAKQIQQTGPTTPWLFQRLFGKPKDSVQSRAANLPPAGLAGVRAKRILVFHLADKAGPHLEAYLEIDGTAYNIGVKRLSPAVLQDIGLTRNGGGYLTQASCERLKTFWASEFGLKQTRWLAQSTDHKPHEARMAWGTRNDGVVGYGAGDLRQVLDECDVVVSTTGKSVEFHDPLIDRHRKAFVFKSMPVTESRPSNILGVGRKENPPPPQVEKLKLTFHKDVVKFQRLVGDAGMRTLKEDGASLRFRTTRRGSMFWSPRISKVTGAHIMYDSKVRDWVGVRSAVPIEGMGEFLAFRPQPWFWFLAPPVHAWAQRFELLRWLEPLAATRLEQCTAAEVGGLLNANRPIPDDIEIRLKLYLVSKVGRQHLAREAYRDNYQRVQEVARLHPDWAPVTPIRADQVDATVAQRGIEGVVGVPDGQSLVDGGYKLKTRGDGFDWEVTRVALARGERGGVAGVVWFRSLESERHYKIGGGPLGSQALREDMLLNPEKYVGRVYEVACFEGHEGRAAHVVREHPDKGAF